MTAWRLRSFVLLLLCLAGCRDDPETPAERRDAPLFLDKSAESGLAFRHWNGMTGEHYYCEIVGPGGALFDYDNDGDLDLYLVQGNLLGPDDTPEETLFALPPGSELPLSDRLYRNDLRAGAGVRFTDVTAGGSGLAAHGYGMGVAVGDVDNDGWLDLYVTNFGANQMWHNEGAGADGRVTFRDVTEASGTGETRWSTSAAFFDFDRDGWLDLYVANYVDYSVVSNHPCYSPSGRRDYCGPRSFPGITDRLWRNRGPGADGRVTFEDVSGRAGILAEASSGLGVTTLDFDGDGWLDLYVANDLRPNVLWVNQGPGANGEVTFENGALALGSAVNLRGKAEASMGVVAADFDGDSDPDLFLTHLKSETNTLYRNDGQGFLDRSLPSGLGAPSVRFTAFGAAALDVDNDGWLDLAAVNGSVNNVEELAAAGDPFPLHMPNQLFRNLGGEGFADWTGAAGEAFQTSEVSRGLVAGDIDNDGDTDLVVHNNNGPARLLWNASGQRRSWVGLRIVDPRLGRDALGARVTVRTPSGAALTRWVKTDGGYCSARDPRVLVGLGEERDPVTVEVRWPDGETEVWPEVVTGSYIELRRGER